ncbi:unnamed protein product [Clonostachys rhizophaga]|uniref:Uncharacterized protein n=1 Tax=Clonostachys rhizophaga TaxID=160324 RepID=A0A9N9YKE5_9HYPO|nr:unnamed protein product [Clonostachys rhizophaga]
MTSPTTTIAELVSRTTETAVASCTTAVPDENGYVPSDACNANYGFYPSFAANCAFAVVFGISFTAHFVQAIAWKKRFCWVLLMGVSWELLAFILRTVGSKDQQNTAYAIAGELFFLLAPLWINAFVYMTAARVVYYAVDDQSVWRIKATWLTQIFVWIDVVCFIIQAGGGVLMSNDGAESDQNLIDIGKKIYMAGCGAQLGFIIVFIGLMVRVYMKMRATPSLEANMSRAMLLFWTLIGVLLFIVMRIIFRLVEFGPGAGSDNEILAHEAYALCLDALPMTLAVLLLNAVHPGWVLRGANSEFPRATRQERKLAKAEKKAAKQQAKLDKKSAKEEKKLKKRGDATFVALDNDHSSVEEVEMGPRPTAPLQPYSPYGGHQSEYATYEDIGDSGRRV